MKSLKELLLNTNSAFAAEMLEDAIAIHAIAGYECGKEIKLAHHRICSTEDLLNLRKSCPDSWIRLIFVYDDGSTSAEDIWLEEVNS